MGQHSEKIKQSLMDAAEELYAQNGLDAVSNRRITEHAGTANHSAIAYHFGSREDFLTALIGRHFEEMEARRAELASQLTPDADVRSILACRILPWVEKLASLPRPSWRARFMFQVISSPSAAELLTRKIVETNNLHELTSLTQIHLAGINPRVLRARSEILGNMVMGVCADYEAQVQAGTAEGDWIGVGYFLVDAAAGLLGAPVTHRDDFPLAATHPILI